MPLVNSKMKITELTLSLTHPHVVPNLYDLLILEEQIFLNNLVPLTSTVWTNIQWMSTGTETF